MNDAESRAAYEQAAAQRERFDRFMKGFSHGAAFTPVHSTGLANDHDFAAGWRLGRDQRAAARDAAEAIYGKVYGTVRLAVKGDQPL